jgi:hypothetical protein
MDDANRTSTALPVAQVVPAPDPGLCGGVQLTPPADLLPRLVEIIRGWERAEAITVSQAWLSPDTGTWRIEWTEHPKTGIEQYRGGETTSKVSLLIEDIKEAAKTHGVDVRHIIPWRGGGLQIWYDDAGHQRTEIYDPAGDRAIAIARACRSAS